MTKAADDARQFVVTDAKREAVPLILGLFSPSGGGKTYSALRLAVGIQKVVGGDIGFVDTESRRALAYADKIKFRHVDFKAPFRSSDYLDAVRQLVGSGCKTVIVDSMSHEHEGPGGMVDFQEAELDRMAGEDYGKRERMKMLAWAKPKAARRALLNGLLQLDVNLILCFRAKQTAKPVKVGNKTEVVQMGFMPIAGDEFVFECMLAALFMPGAGGVPTWSSEYVGENMMIKLPLQFRALASETPSPMSEALGERLATWARGAPAAKTEAPKTTPPADDGFPGDQSRDDAPGGQGGAPAGEATGGDAPQPDADPPAQGPEDPPPPQSAEPPADGPTQGGLALDGGATTTGQEADNLRRSAAHPPEDQAVGFAAYADALAEATTWDAIKAAQSALMKSDDWKEAGKPMQGKARALAHVRLMELVATGAFKLDFILDAHAWRNYIEAETDVDAFRGNRGAFESGEAFNRLPHESQVVLQREADRRTLELSTSTGFE